MDATAADDAERARNRAKLYAPPVDLAAGRGRRQAAAAGAGAGASSRAAGPGAGPAPGGMTRTQALAMMADLNAEDAQLSSRGRTR